MWIPLWFIIVVIFVAVFVWETLLDSVPDELFFSKYNPLIWMAALVIYPFIRISERHLPRSERTPFF